MTTSPLEIARETVRVGTVVPGTGVSVYGIIHGGLPLLVGGLTVVLLVIQIIVAWRSLQRKAT